MVFGVFDRIWYNIELLGFSPGVGNFGAKGSADEQAMVSIEKAIESVINTIVPGATRLQRQLEAQTLSRQALTSIITVELLHVQTYLYYHPLSVNL